MKRYQISSYHEIYEDSYEEGELDRVNSYEIDPHTIEADTPMEAIAKYYNSYMPTEFKPENAMLDDEQANIVYYSSLEDESGLKPSEDELAEWMEGRMKLYANNATIFVYELVEVDLTSVIKSH
ncbi:hypothetical protein EBT16_11205 [bacterium]|nr:hypothetical protein [bacterium]